MAHHRNPFVESGVGFFLLIFLYSFLCASGKSYITFLSPVSKGKRFDLL